MKNQHLKTGIMVCLVALWGLFIAGCSSKTEQPDPNKSQTNTAANADKNAQSSTTAQNNTSDNTATQPNPVAVTVNGKDITEEEVDAVVAPMIQQIMARGQQLPPQFIQQYRERIRQSAVERLIINNLLDEEVKKANLTVTDQQVMDKLQEIAQQQNMTIAQFQERLEQVGQNFERIKGEVRKGLLYTKVAEAQWEGKIDVTDEEAKTYFDENKEEYSTPEQVRASHILIKPEEGADPNEAKPKALAKTQDLLKQVKDGADFAELAKANSDCPSSARGGDLDFFQKGAMVKPFEDAAFSMKVGEVSDVVETQFGYHIIKVTDHKDETNPTFEEVKDKVIEQLKQTKQGDIAEKYIDSLRQAATIVYPPGKEPAPAQPASPGMVQ